MYPELIHLDSIILRSYGLLIALAIAISFATGLILFKKQGLPLEEGLRSGLFMLFGAVAGARLMYVFMHWDRFATGLDNILKISGGGMIYWGGVTGCVLALWIYSGIRSSYFWRLGDTWAPAAAFGITVGWIGCLLAGCCYGLPTNGPLAITFHDTASLAPVGTPLYPTQVYYAMAEVTIICVVLWLRDRKKFEGQVFLWYLILEANASLLVERYRGDFRGQVFDMDMSPGQFLATLILIGAVIALLIKARNKLPRKTASN